MKLPLRRTPVHAERQDHVTMGPRGLSLSFQSEPIAQNMLAWIRSQKDPDGWYRSFAAPAPASRSGLALTTDQAWVMLALEAAGLRDEALDLADAVSAASFWFPRERTDVAFSTTASAWTALILMHLFGSERREVCEHVADTLLQSVNPDGLVSAGADPQHVFLMDSLLACALWEKLGRPTDLEAARRVRMRFALEDLYGRHTMGDASISLEALVLSAFMTHDPERLLQVEADLYDSSSGGCRWEVAWRRTSHQAACFLALAEDDLALSHGRAASLRHQAIAALINGVTPPADMLGVMYLERESQLAYAAMLYLGLVGHRGIHALWS